MAKSLTPADISIVRPDSQPYDGDDWDDQLPKPFGDNVPDGSTGDW